MALGSACLVVTHQLPLSDVMAAAVAPLVELPAGIFMTNDLAAKVPRPFIKLDNLPSLVKHLQPHTHARVQVHVRVRVRARARARARACACAGAAAFRSSVPPVSFADCPETRLSCPAPPDEIGPSECVLISYLSILRPGLVSFTSTLFPLTAPLSLSCPSLGLCFVSCPSLL